MGKKGNQEHMREMKWKWIKSRDRVKKKQRLNGSRERKGEGKEMTRNKWKWSLIKGKKNEGNDIKHGRYEIKIKRMWTRDIEERSKTMNGR